MSTIPKIPSKRSLKASTIDTKAYPIMKTPARRPSANTNEVSPAPGTKEFVLLRNAQKGNAVSPIQAFNAGTIGCKRKQAEPSEAKFVLFTLPAMQQDERDRTVALFFVGNFFAVKERIKDSVKWEQEVNRVTIPVPRDAMPAKWLSRGLLSMQMQVMGTDLKDMKEFMQKHMEQAWMLYAPPIVDLTADEFSLAAVDATVDLEEYAKCWERALSGKPIHYDHVFFEQYYVDEEEVLALHNLYNAQDPTFKRK